MHILVITPGFPSDENDTDCIPPMQEYFRKLIQVDPAIKVSVIAIHYPHTSKAYIWNNINVYPCNGRSSAQPIRIFYWLRAMIQAVKIHKENKINIIHSFWISESALVGSLLRGLLNVRHINTMMGQDVKTENKYLKLLPLKSIIKIALSEFQENIFYNSTGKHGDTIISWGIDTIYPLNQERTIDIVGAGSLIPVKNFKLFVEVVTLLKEKLPSIKCLLIGEGNERSGIEKLIRDLKLTGNISLLGHIPREEVLACMGKSKILLHTSNFESFGYVITEALASGCYVACKNVGCAKKSDKLFIADSANEFVDTILEILNSKSDYNPELPFPLSETVSAYLKLYRDYCPR